MATKPNSTKGRAAKSAAKKAAPAKKTAPAKKAAAATAKKAVPAKKSAVAARSAKKAAVKKSAAKPAKKSAAKKSAAPKPAQKAAPKKAVATKRPAAQPAKKATTKKPAPKKAAAPKPAAKAKAPAKKSAAKTARAKAATPKAAAAPPAPERQHVDRARPETLRLLTSMPSLTANDVAASLRFYVEGLGFTIKERWEKNGELLGAMLVAGDCEIGLGQDDWGKGRDRVKGLGFSLYYDTAQDLDVIATRARENGIEVDGPKDSQWNSRLLGVTDPDGFKIWFQRYNDKE